MSNQAKLQEVENETMRRSKKCDSVGGKLTRLIGFKPEVLQDFTDR
jgi:hypothetical protein